jgi:hypothetical protein
MILNKQVENFFSDRDAEGLHLSNDQISIVELLTTKQNTNGNLPYIRR